MQRSDNDDHVRRVRFNAASITVRDSQKNQNFSFLKIEVYDPKFPVFTNRMNLLKHEERGLDAVCEVMERYEKKAIEKNNIEAIKFMISVLGGKKEDILKKYSEREYALAVEELGHEGTFHSR